MLKDVIIADMRKAIKNKNVEKRDILRVLMAEIDRGQTKSDGEILSLIKKMCENINQTTKDPIEIEILIEYLPQELSEKEIVVIVDELVKFENYSTIKDMGKIMKFFKINHSSKYDGKMLSEIVIKKLN